ncbi:MAG: metallophosphoesterase [Anaerolineales bacterium]|nr:metallophosphoesterase [Anaerolineales bacterium]
MKRFLWLLALLWLAILACTLDTPAVAPTLAAPSLTPTPFLPATVTPAPSTSTPTLLPSPPSPPTATATPLTGIRFAVIGDYGTAGDGLAQVAALVKVWQPDFIITTGDNNYPRGTYETIDENIGQYFHEYIYPYRGEYGAGAETNRFFPVLGNHDWMTDNAQPYLDYFTLPGNERYYDFEWEFVHFFALDADYDEPDGIGLSSAQADWLEAGMAATDAPWQVVYMHIPPYSSGHYGPTKAVQWPFAAWGADVVIAGHDHVYERLQVEGIPYIINGLGGDSRYEFEAVLPESQVRYSSNFGAMLVEATRTQMHFQFVNINGEVIDDYILEK